LDGSKRGLKMSIKATVRKVAAIFEPQKSVVRAEDAKLPTSLAANEVTKTRVEQPSANSTAAVALPVEKPIAHARPDLSGLLKPGPKKVAVIAAPVVADIADPPAPTQPAPTPVAAAAPVVAPPQTVERPKVETPVVKTETPATAEYSLVAMLAQVLKTLTPEDLQKALERWTAKPAAAEPIEAESVLLDGEIPGSSVPVFVDESETITNSETGETISRAEFNRRQAEGMSRAIADRSRIPRSPQTEIRFDKPSGINIYSRR
jgi:hypothetical protein